MSEFKVEAVRIGTIEKHQNADSLSITQVLGGYPCIIKTGDFAEGEMAIYVPVDALVPVTRPEFAFLAPDAKNGQARIKARRLRGIFSMGLLVKCPPNIEEGSDCQKLLGIEKYLPPAEREPNDVQPKQLRKGWPWWKRALARIFPSLFAKPKQSIACPVYDIEGFRKYQRLLNEGEEVSITEKIHGCVNRMTLIWMADGSRKKVTKVKAGDEVLGVDSNGNVVATPVIQTFRNGTTSEWIRIRVTADNAGRGSSFRSLTVTPNHKIWSLEARDYVRADELKTGARVSIMRTDQELTPLQKSVLIGKMLGDGSLHICPSGSASVVFGHTETDEEYVDWTMRALGGISTGEKGTTKSGYGSTIVRSCTTFRREITILFEEWADGRKKKRVPKWVAAALDPISIAFWYMDDGSLAHADGQEDRATFATCAFTEEDCSVLVDGLAKFGIESTVFEANGPRIRLDSANSERLFLLIAPYVPPCMQRKLPDRYKGHSGWMPGDRQYKPSRINSEVIDITPVVPVSTQRLDLETGTHNYFASGILVHNCNARFVYSKGKFHLGSRTMFGRSEKSDWGVVAKKYDLARKLKDLPDLVVLGEVYGNVQDLKYGLPNSVDLVVFDVMRLKTREFLSRDEFLQFCRLLDLPTVPELYRGPWGIGRVTLAEGKTLMPNANHIREGIVIKPVAERIDPHFGRVILKLHGEGYLTRKEAL